MACERQEEIAQSERRYRLLVEHASQGIAVVQDARFVFANPAIGALAGRRAEEIVGLHIGEVFHAEDAPRAAARHAARNRGEEVEPEFDIRIVLPDGTIRWVHIDVVSIDWNGRPASLGLVTDVTGRRAAAEALRRSEERLKSALVERETILQSALVGIALGVDRRYRWVNRKLEELLGYGPGELVGQSSRVEFEDEAAWRAFGELAYPLLAAGRPYRGDLRMRRKDGSFIWLEVCGIALDPTDLAMGTIWTYLDVSERRKAEDETRAALEKQRQLNELKSRFVSMTSHEFRTPLAAILSSAELLKRYSARLPASEKDELHASIEAGVKRMTDLLDNVLAFGRAESGRLGFEPHRVDLRAFCDELIEELRRARRAEGDAQHAIDLEWRMPGRTACVDEKLLRQILGNLLANALKYSPGGGRVSLEVGRQDGALTFVVADEGIGIPPADLPDLFGVFHRAANVATIPGTGLGLAIVKRAVERHGGGVTVSSTLGRGSRFTVSLPAGPE